MTRKRSIPKSLLLKHIAKLATKGETTEKDWGCRMEKNGIGDYGRDEHYRKLDGSIRFGLRITYYPPECTVLYFETEESA